MSIFGKEWHIKILVSLSICVLYVVLSDRIVRLKRHGDNAKMKVNLTVINILKIQQVNKNSEVI